MLNLFITYFLYCHCYILPKLPILRETTTLLWCRNDHLFDAVPNLRSLYVVYLLYFNENTQPLHIFSFALNSPRMVLWGIRMI